MEAILRKPRPPIFPQDRIPHLRSGAPNEYKSLPIRSITMSPIVPAGNRVQARLPSGIPLMYFEGGMRAIDKKTGEVRWWLSNEKVLAATVEHGSPGFLVLIENRPLPGAPNGLGSQSVFRAITRLGGEQLFEQSMLCPSGLR